MLDPTAHICKTFNMDWMDSASRPVYCKPSNRTSMGDAVDLEDSGRRIRRSNAKVKDQTCLVKSGWRQPLVDGLQLK